MRNSGSNVFDDTCALVAKDPRQGCRNMLRLHRQVGVTDATRDDFDKYFAWARVSEITRYNLERLFRRASNGGVYFHVRSRLALGCSY
jgi:hypothetical protein